MKFHELHPIKGVCAAPLFSAGRCGLAYAARTYCWVLKLQSDTATRKTKKKVRLFLNSVVLCMLFMLYPLLEWWEHSRIRLLYFVVRGKTCERSGLAACAKRNGYDLHVCVVGQSEALYRF